MKRRMAIVEFTDQNENIMGTYMHTYIHIYIYIHN